MSIDASPESKLLAAVGRPSWGDVTVAGEMAAVIRFVLIDRVVTYPVSQVTRWEHVFGDRETLAISVPGERVLVEGHDLLEIRAALDLGRLMELRVNYPLKSGVRPGPQVRLIAIEAG